jgi:hypothetical protein
MDLPLFDCAHVPLSISDDIRYHTDVQGHLSDKENLLPVKRKRGPNYSPAMKDYARSLYFSGMRPPAITRALADRYHDERLPDERTVRTWTQGGREDESGPWTMIAQGDPKVVLPVLRALIEASKGKVTVLTNAEAEELSRLGCGVDEMPAIGMYHWARAMIATRNAEEPVGPLLHYLAFRPWKDHGQEYTRAFAAGWVTELRAFCPEDVEWLNVVASRRQRSSSLDMVTGSD